MTKIFVGFLSFAKFVIRNDKGIASFGPMNVLAGIGMLGLSFCFVVGFSGLQSDRIPSYGSWAYDSKEKTPIQACVMSRAATFYLLNWETAQYSPYFH